MGGCHYEEDSPDNRCSHGVGRDFRDGGRRGRVRGTPAGSGLSGLSGLFALYKWTGCYVGGHVGGLWAHKEWVDHEPTSVTFGQSDGSHDPSGVLGGLQAGCDYQFAGGFVVGVAGDYAWSRAKQSNASILFPGAINQSTVKSLASVTGRLGYAWDRFLGYVKGGGAWENDDHFFTDGINTGTASLTRSGWTVGIGGEYAFTNFVSGFVEYDYYNFGDRDVLFTGRFPASPTISRKPRAS